MITENYRLVEERVAAACTRSGRKREEVTLIAVSKTKPVSMIRELMEIGVVHLLTAMMESSRKVGSGI